MTKTIVYFCILAFAASSAVADFPNAPDFKRTVKYISWYRNALPDVSDRNNAYEAYAAFMPHLDGGGVAEEDWPKFRGMLSIPQHEREAVGMSTATGADAWPPGPGPWRSVFHDAWTMSYGQTKGVLKKYRAAAKRKALVAPFDLSGDGKNGRLVSLRYAYIPYQRQCALGLLEGAWQMTDDKVSTKRLRSAIAANLRTARQMRNSLSVEEQAAAVAIRLNTYESIRWAFAHGIFNDKNATQLAKLLRKIDGDRVDCSPAASGECAKWLDGLQYIFSPFSGGKGQFNGNRYREITGQTMGGGNRFGIGARLETNPEGSGQAILDGYREMGRQFRGSYSAEKRSEIRRAFDGMSRATKINRGLFLGGSHRLVGLYSSAGRAEVQRRGVRLLAELFAHKGRKGEWPNALSDLGKKARSGVEKDGYCGKEFVYGVIGDDMFLYSVGSNCEDDGGLVDASGQGDVVLWPIPDAEDWVAACDLTRLPVAALTKLSDVNKSRLGKVIVVAAEVRGTANEISTEHGRIHRANLSGGGSAELIYYESVAAGMKPHQTLESGMKIRVRAKVAEINGAIKLLMEKPTDLARAW